MNLNKIASFIIVFIILSFFVFNNVYEEEQLTAEEKIYGLSLFWSEVKYNFAFFDRVPNLDWDSVYQEYIREVMNTRTIKEYYDTLKLICALLKDGHTSIEYPPFVEEQIDYVPLAIRNFGKDLVITKVFNEQHVRSIPVGSYLLKIDDINAYDYLLDFVYPYIPASSERKRIHNAARHILSGNANEKLKITIKTPYEEVENLIVKRNYKSLNIKPDEILEYKKIDANFAYIAINSFDDPKIIAEFEKIVPYLMKAKGLIIDVRKNAGGNSLFGYSIISWFTDEKIPVPKTESREHIAIYKAWGNLSDQYFWFREFKKYAQDKAWKKIEELKLTTAKRTQIKCPIVVLFGIDTGSAAEAFLVALDCLDIGILIGQPSAGVTGQPLSLNLPGGGRARICVGRNTYPDGKEFAGSGVQPDIFIEPKVEDIINRKDSELEKAIEILKGRIK